jgi:2Fe-2S ferredoxin
MASGTVRIRIAGRDGAESAVDAALGDTLMETIRKNGHDELLAICGGCCSCATCHVYVDPDWLPKTGARTEMEESMLSFAAATQDNSRLSCQIVMSDALDGIVLRLPEGQH